MQKQVNKDRDQIGNSVLSMARCEMCSSLSSAPSLSGSIYRSRSYISQSLLQVMRCTSNLLNISSSFSHISRTCTLSAVIFLSHFSNSSSQGRACKDGMESEILLNRDPEAPPKLFVVQPRLRPDKLLHAKLSEALNLANSLQEQRDCCIVGGSAKGDVPPHIVVQNPVGRFVKSDTYFGPGTVETITCHLNAVEPKDGFDGVFINAILTGIQQRNLERVFRKPVLDRVGLIIEIFNAHAETKEAKLQAELAAIMYKKSKLVRWRGSDGRVTFGAYGEAEVVSARGRGSGGRGFISGAGETELQLQRRRILERKNRLISQIEEVRRTRALQRLARKRRGSLDGHGLATIAVVGYTNTGKSTLVSALSDADLYSDDRLFATVDPRLRHVILPSGKKVLLSDTVGFISDLPVELVDAFHATLEEVVEADLLVHVIDASAINIEEQCSSVIQVLQQIGVSKEKLEDMIEVWNKVDLLEERATENGLHNETDVSEDLSNTGERAEGDKNLLYAEGVNEDTGYSSVVENDESENGRDSLGTNDGKIAFMLSSIEHMGKGDNTLSTSHISLGKLEVSGNPREHQDFKYVETSAITGTGLGELLSLIDMRLEKLNMRKISRVKAFDRKWRACFEV